MEKVLIASIILGITLGVLAGLGIFMTDIQPPKTLRPEINLLYAYFRIDRIGDNVTGMNSDYLLTYILVLNISNNYAEDIRPYTIDFSMPQYVRINNKTYSVNDKAQPGKLVVLFDSHTANESEGTIEAINKIPLQEHYLSIKYVNCWIPRQGYNIIVIRGALPLDDEAAEWLKKHLSRTGVLIMIKIIGDIIDSRGHAETTLLLRARLDPGRNNDYYLYNLPQGTSIYFDGECQGVTFTKMNR